MKFIKQVGSLPSVVIVLAVIMAAYMTLVAFTNITDFNTNQEFVRRVFEMDTTFESDGTMWRSIENDLLADIAYIGLIVWESLAAIVLWWGVVELLRAFRAGREWTMARRITSVGLLMVLVLFGFGFITVGGEWFVMWQSAVWNGVDAALRNFILAAFALVLVHLPSPDWATGTPASEPEKVSQVSPG